MWLESTSFEFPSMPFPNLIQMWHCGDLAKNIPPYKMLRSADVKHLKHGSKKLSNMKTLMKHVDRAARLKDKSHLLKRSYTVEDTLVLYHEVKSCFAFKPIRKRRRLEQISWKTYYNIIIKRKGVLVGFEEGDENDD